MKNQSVKKFFSTTKTILISIDRQRLGDQGKVESHTESRDNSRIGLDLINLD